MSNQNRRSFLKKSMVGASAIAATPFWAKPSYGAGGHAADRVELGNTGVKASRLAMGTGYRGSARSSDHTRMGQKRFNELVFRGYDAGVNFFDLADLYGTHPFVKKALKEIPRDDTFLLTKIWFREEDWNKPSGGATEEVNRYCKELGTDYLDSVLIHCVTDSNWTQDLEQVRAELTQMKEDGKVRTIGVSCHDFGALEVAAEDPWTEVIFARINNKGKVMDGPPEEVAKVLKTAKANGKAVVGMKIFGAGQLTQPEQKDSSLTYVFENNLIDAMTIGMRSTAEVDDTLTRIEKNYTG